MEGKINRPPRRGGFDVVSTAVGRDPRLSWKAKGLFYYLACRPDGWSVYVSHLKTVSRDGRDATRAGLDELIAVGLVLATKVRTKGQFAGWDYDLVDPMDPGDLAGAAYLAGLVDAESAAKAGRKRKPARQPDGQEGGREAEQTLEPDPSRLASDDPTNGKPGPGSSGDGKPETNNGETVAKEESSDHSKTSFSDSMVPSRSTAATGRSVGGPGEGNDGEEAETRPSGGLAQVVAFFLDRWGEEAREPAGRFFDFHQSRGWSYGVGQDWRRLAAGWMENQRQIAEPDALTGDRRVQLVSGQRSGKTAVLRVQGGRVTGAAVAGVTDFTFADARAFWLQFRASQAVDFLATFDRVDALDGPPAGGTYRLRPDARLKPSSR